MGSESEEQRVTFYFAIVSGALAVKSCVALCFEGYRKRMCDFFLRAHSSRFKFRALFYIQNGRIHGLEKISSVKFVDEAFDLWQAAETEGRLEFVDGKPMGFTDFIGIYVDEKIQGLQTQVDEMQGWIDQKQLTEGDAAEVEVLKGGKI